jgi:glyoxylase-like metal-dependent hydrolase (beta-lactamase superfamily II)
MPTPESQLNIHVEIDMQYAENGYVLSVRDGGDCWMVDPGLPPHAERMAAFAASHDLTLKAILLTHAHLDHCAGVDDVRERMGNVPIYLGQPEWSFLTDPAGNLSAGFGVPITVRDDNVLDLRPGSSLSLDGLDWTVFDTSGHSPGGRSLYCASAGVVFVGDALFSGSIGRTDFHHSDHERLIRNIRENLLTLPGSTQVWSGHGPATTIEAERETNPFLR